MVFWTIKINSIVFENRMFAYLECSSVAIIIQVNRKKEIFRSEKMLGTLEFGFEYRIRFGVCNNFVCVHSCALSMLKLLNSYMRSYFTIPSLKCSTNLIAMLFFSLYLNFNECNFTGKNAILLECTCFFKWIKYCTYEQRLCCMWKYIIYLSCPNKIVCSFDASFSAHSI